MLGPPRDLPRRGFLGLALVDGWGIGQHQLIELTEAIAHRSAVKRDHKLAFLQIDPLHDAKITVVDLTIVVVLDLHDLVAWTEGPAKTLDVRLAGWIERLLQLDVQRACAKPAAVHRAQHLN